MISDEMTKFFYKFDYKIQVLHRISQLLALHVFPRDVKTPISKHFLKFILVHPHPPNKKNHKKQTTKQKRSWTPGGSLSNAAFCRCGKGFLPFKWAGLNTRIHSTRRCSFFGYSSMCFLRRPLSFDDPVGRSCTMYFFLHPRVCAQY